MSRIKSKQTSKYRGKPRDSDELTREERLDARRGGFFRSKRKGELGLGRSRPGGPCDYARFNPYILFYSGIENFYVFIFLDLLINNLFLFPLSSQPLFIGFSFRVDIYLIVRFCFCRARSDEELRILKNWRNAFTVCF